MYSQMSYVHNKTRSSRQPRYRDYHGRRQPCYRGYHGRRQTRYRSYHGRRQLRLRRIEIKETCPWQSNMNSIHYKALKYSILGNVVRHILNGIKKKCREKSESEGIETRSHAFSHKLVQSERNERPGRRPSHISLAVDHPPSHISSAVMAKTKNVVMSTRGDRDALAADTDLGAHKSGTVIEHDCSSTWTVVRVSPKSMSGQEFKSELKLQQEISRFLEITLCVHFPCRKVSKQCIFLGTYFTCTPRAGRARS